MHPPCRGLGSMYPPCGGPGGMHPPCGGPGGLHTPCGGPGGMHPLCKISPPCGGLSLGVTSLIVDRRFVLVGIQLEKVSVCMAKGRQILY